MLMPPQVTIRGFTPSAEIEALVLERVQWLERYYQGIVSCRVSIDAPHRHRRAGRHIHVAIELTLPDTEPVIVNHEPSLHGLLKDTGTGEHAKESEIEGVHRYAPVVIREAFDAARRQLQDAARRQRGAVKVHEVPVHGLVSALSSDDDYGFIESNGTQFYFHRSSVLNSAFDELAIGSPVAFVAEKGEKGPQASTVRMLGKHHYTSP
jgi:cold shock CspA family protein